MESHGEPFTPVRLLGVCTSCCVHEFGLRRHGALLPNPCHQDPPHADPAESLHCRNLLARRIVSFHLIPNLFLAPLLDRGYRIYD